jgi:hypothetical protein
MKSVTLPENTEGSFSNIDHDLNFVHVEMEVLIVMGYEFQDQL